MSLIVNPWGIDPCLGFFSNECCRAAKFPDVTGVDAAKPSSAALGSLEFSLFESRLLSLGVGVARRARTRPATGSNCRPRESSDPLLVMVDPLVMLDASLSESVPSV